MLLYLDTASDIAKIKLFDNEGSFAKESILSSNLKLTDELLSKIDELLSGDLTVIDGLFINSGEKSYTGMRIGTTTINFLGLALDLEPVEIESEKEIVYSKRMKFAEPIIPTYKSAPFITTKRSRL